MKLFLLLILLSFFTLCIKAQPWSGTSSGNIYYNQGNVGIGTANFIGDEKLNINGRLRIGGFQDFGGSHSLHISENWGIESSIYIYQAGISAFTIGSKPNDTNFYLTSDYYMEGLGYGPRSLTLTNTGNIGIGTTSPTQKFSIAGTSVSGIASQTNISAFVNNAIRINGSVANVSQDAITYQSGGGGGGAAIAFGRGGSYDTFMSFYTNSSATSGSIAEQMRITSSGNVGIGTTTPGNKLDVNGTIRAKELRVESGWADFVFDKGYNLQNLSEVELFINEHKHLPDVPDVKSVEKNGVNLGEMNALLLKKIEELTLYAIKQNKKIEALEKAVNNLISK